MKPEDVHVLIPAATGREMGAKLKGLLEENGFPGREFVLIFRGDDGSTRCVGLPNKDKCVALARELATAFHRGRAAYQDTLPAPRTSGDREESKP